MKRQGHRYRDAKTGDTLDVWFPKSDKILERSCLAQKYGMAVSDLVEVEMTDAEALPGFVENLYLRLYLLSEREFRPNTINLDGIFDLLVNVAWTSADPVVPEQAAELRHQVASEKHDLTVYFVDKIPWMVDDVVPACVRIGDADQVRLGAHLARGTTVMHEGFVNFNAGTLGAAMIEGRVTPGVTVGTSKKIKRGWA